MVSQKAQPYCFIGIFNNQEELVEADIRDSACFVQRYISSRRAYEFAD